MQAMVLLTEKTPSGRSKSWALHRWGLLSQKMEQPTLHQPWAQRSIVRKWFWLPPQAGPAPVAEWEKPLARPFSVQGTIWQTQPCRRQRGQWGLPCPANRCGGAYEYADRGQSWLAATTPPISHPCPNSDDQGKPAERRPSWNAISSCLRTYGVPSKCGDWITGLLPWYSPPGGAPDLFFQIPWPGCSKVNPFLLGPQASWGYQNQLGAGIWHLRCSGRRGCVAFPSSRGLNTTGEALCWGQNPPVWQSWGELTRQVHLPPKHHLNFAIFSSFSLGSGVYVVIHSSENQCTTAQLSMVNPQNRTLSERS